MSNTPPQRIELPFLEGDEAFPPVSLALETPNGLLAMGDDLSPTRLIEAYRRGIFPWYSQDRGEPILWWSPSPRMVFFTERMHVSRSLAKVLKRASSMGLHLLIDTNFNAVIRQCAHRPEGSWIGEEMIQAYQTLHHMGHAHSLELWQVNANAAQEKSLVGGLYGVSLGRMFYGESMFSKIPNASKIILAALTAWLHQQGAPMMDCQIYSKHLHSLGAIQISRDDFLYVMEDLIAQPDLVWPTQLSWSAQVDTRTQSFK